LEQSRRKNQKNDTSRVGKDGLLLQEDIQIENQKFVGIMWEEKTFEKGGKAKFHRIIPPLNGRGA